MDYKAHTQQRFKEKFPGYRYNSQTISELSDDDLCHIGASEEGYFKTSRNKGATKKLIFVGIWISISSFYFFL